MEKRVKHELELFNKSKEYGVIKIDTNSLYIYSRKNNRNIVNSLYCKLDNQYPFKGCIFYILPRRECIIEPSNLYMRLIINICKSFHCNEHGIADNISYYVNNIVYQDIQTLKMMHCKQYLYEYEINKGNEKEAMDSMQEYDTKLEHVVAKKIHNYVEILDIDFDIFRK